MTPTHLVDVAILGTGTAGMAAYRAAALHTDRILLIESGSYGTTCARVGCMPSKLLIAAAEAAHHVEISHRFGVGEPGRAVVDGRKVMERVRRERDRFVGFVLDSVESFPPEHRLTGTARFLDDRTVAVGDLVIRARSIVIATGSRPKVPAMFADLGDRLLTSDAVFSWETLPDSVVVFGMGVVGLEIGQALHRLGVRVKLVGVRGVVGGLSDPKVRETARALFAAELGADPDASIKEVARDGDRVRVVTETPSGLVTEHFSWALAATGRVPNVDRLDLGNTSLLLDPAGVPVHDRNTLRCGDTAIFLAGDASNDIPLLHEAADEGKIAGDNAGRFPRVEPGPRRSPLSVVFCDPQIAMVGDSWERIAPRKPVVGRVSFVDQGRSRVMLQNQGLAHLYADRVTGRFLGAEMVGPRMEHLGHLLAWAHQQGLTVQQMLAMPFYHPVVEEGIRTALRDAVSQLPKES